MTIVGNDHDIVLRSEALQLPAEFVLGFGRRGPRTHDIDLE